MKNKTLGSFLVIIGILFLSSTIQVINTTNISIGVETGQESNYKVITNEFRSVSDRSYFRYLLTFQNITDIPVIDNFTIKTVIEAVNVSMSTYEGDIFGTTVTKLPSNVTNDGTLQYFYNNNTWNMTTGFLLGTPVVSTNWTYWGQFIDSLPSFSNSNHTVTAIKTESDQIFNSTIRLSFSYLPQNITYDGVEKLVYGQVSIYDKVTGILQYEEITLDLETPIQTTLTQHFVLQLTSESPTTSHIENNATPGFGLMVLIPAFITGTVLFYNKKRET